MTHNQQPQITPTDELISQLKATVEQQDNRTYRHLMNQLDWSLASADQLDQAIGVTLALGDTRRARKLTELGRERFPNEDVFARVWRLLNPPPARVVAPRWRSSMSALDASIQWLDQHADEYEPGHWLAVKSGQLVADAPTRQELDKIIESLGGPEILAIDSVIQQVAA